MVGNLSEDIEIVRPTRTQRPDGGWVTKYERLLKTYAQVKAMSFENEFLIVQSEMIEGFEVIIRYRQDVYIKNGDFIRWRGRELRVQGLPAPYGNKKYMKIITRAVNDTSKA